MDRSDSTDATHTLIYHTGKEEKLVHLDEDAIRDIIGEEEEKEEAQKLAQRNQRKFAGNNKKK